MEKILIVSSTKQSQQTLAELFNQSPRPTILMAASGAAARRLLLETDCDLVLINTPLQDEFGGELAVRAARGGCGTLLLVRAEQENEIGAQVEDYGVFVELTPNLSGLAERHEGVHTGMPVAVYVKSIIPERMKIKLVIIDALECSTCKSVSAADYYITGGHIDRWRYTPECSTGKLIETIF